MASPMCLLLLFAGLLSTASAQASMVEMVHTYMNENDEELHGFLIYEDRPGETMRPGLMLFDGPWGDGGGSSIREYAREFARRGMVTFLPDYLPTTNDPDTAEGTGSAAGAGFGTDVAHAQDTVLRGYQQLAGLDMVDPDMISGIGWCFGGSQLMNLARTGAALQVAVALHAEYPARGDPIPATEGSWNTKYFVEMVGADDFTIPSDARESWVAELTEHTAGTDMNWDLVIFGNTAHGFSMKYSLGFMQALDSMGLGPVTEVDGVYGAGTYFVYSELRKTEVFDRIYDLFERHGLVEPIMTTCGATRDYYRDHECCGVPEKMIPLMMPDTMTD